ncbi:hypothetical protein BaRGS_00036910 [Batillaria attramentaria]|uniref:Secreted protein n=1 Tax=Batillaria attramentaria TaxID=370345 RepID=A0ABD0JA68_9CAEN
MLLLNLSSAVAGTLIVQRTKEKKKDKNVGVMLCTRLKVSPQKRFKCDTLGVIPRSRVKGSTRGLKSYITACFISNLTSQQIKLRLTSPRPKPGSRDVRACRCPIEVP